MSAYTLDENEVRGDGARFWWLFLLTGILWLVASLVIFRFSYVSVASVAYLFGVVAIFFGVNEFFAIGPSSTGWRIVHAILGVLFVVGGVVALVNPFETFAALAGLMSFFLVLKGTFDIVVSIVARGDIPVWWLQLMIGIVEILLAFWAAGYFGRQAVLLVIWVAASCMARGITEIILAFKLHALAKHA
jgi:uncharacterized membrane protein HdeD (DUF308 family)